MISAFCGLSILPPLELAPVNRRRPRFSPVSRLQLARLSLATQTMADTDQEPSKDALGLDIDSLKIGDDDQHPQPSETADKPEDSTATSTAPPDHTSADANQPQSPKAAESATQPVAESDNKAPPREKKKPYVNPERVKTGGAERVRWRVDALRILH
jgi:hypothetical protein